MRTTRAHLANPRPIRPDETTRARLEARLVRTRGCWYMRGPAGVIRDRRPRIQLGGTLVMAYRVTYAIEHGDPGPLTIEHLCANPACVRPDHLTVLDLHENPVADTSTGEGARNARKTHCPQGHPYDAENTGIYVDRLGRPSRWCRTCDRARKERERRARGVQPRPPAKPKKPARDPDRCIRGHDLNDPAVARIDQRKDRTSRACRVCERERKTRSKG